MWSRPWEYGTFFLALIVTIPLFTVFSFLLQPGSAIWLHLRDTVLADYITSSMTLAAGVFVGTLMLGVPAAWLTSVCRFPGQRFFAWSLLLPMAMPAYITGFTYAGIFDVAGPIQALLRQWFDWSYGDYWFPEIRSLGGAIVVMSLVLYPYVYLAVRNAFLAQSVCVLEVSRTLGCGKWRSFFRVALPLARPALAAGAALALMEALADYGTVKYFGVNTFTTGIFRAWFGLGDEAAAAQLSVALLALILVLLLFEKYSRRQAKYHHTTERYRQLPAYQLRGPWAWLGAAACALPLLFGFVIPCLQLGLWALRTAGTMLDSGFVGLMFNTFALGVAASFLTLIVALLIAYSARVSKSWLVRLAVLLAGLGYALPGTVIAIGVVIPFAYVDNALDAWMRATFATSTGLLFSGTLFALVLAYLVRFLTIALQTVQSGLAKVRPSMDDAARSLGAAHGTVLLRVHVPVIRGSLLVALLFVFVEVMKELPATLILRPFNFNTLAVRAYELASDERLADSSTAALAIVVLGLIPVVFLSRAISRARPGHDAA